MTSRKHSIIIAYGKRKGYLLKCLASIRKHGVDSEIIVVDMHNDDLDLSQFQTRYIALNRAQGIFHKSVCLNRAIREASGEYVSIIDCDMVISPGWFQEISKRLHPTTVLVTPVFMQPENATRALMQDKMLFSEFMNQPGRYKRRGKSQITLRRQHLLQYPLREEYIGYGAEDSELNARLAKSFCFYELDKKFAFYHMHHPRREPTPYYRRLSQNRRIYRQHLAGLKPRLGIYVAAYHASKILPTHLAKIAEFTESEFDYYIADNSKEPAEKKRFAEIIQDYKFVTEVDSPSSRHGNTLQYMVEHTANEIIALFDVDAFPLRPWDRWALRKLKRKKVVGVLSHVASREIDYHIHPSFMVFRRSFLEQNHLDLLSGRLSRRRTSRSPSLDPAGKVTCFLKDRKEFNPRHVEALLPTQVEVPFQEPFQWHGSTKLRRGFGVTYNDMIFHFWYSRNLHNSSPIYDDHKQLVVSEKQINQIVKKYTMKKAEKTKVDSVFPIKTNLAKAIRELVPSGGIGLELGAGNLLSAAALAEKCRVVFSLDENKERADRLASLASSNINVLYSPLENNNFPYQHFGQLDAIVVDGVERTNEQWVLPWLSNLRPGGLIFLNDSQRSQTKKLRAIIEKIGFTIAKDGNEEPGKSWVALERQQKAESWIDLLMLSYNRSEYTRLTLESFLEVDCGIPREFINFTVIDQASTDDSVREIATFLRANPGAIDHFIVSEQNRGASGGFGYFLQNGHVSSEFVGKIDNDSIFTPGWLRKLYESLRAHPKLGVVAAQEDARQGENNRAVIDAVGVGYYPARFVGGRFLARKDVFENNIPGGSGVRGWTKFQKKNIQEFDIGWCIPACVIEHVGDWSFHHPKAIKNPKYIKYFKVTGRMR